MRARRLTAALALVFVPTLAYPRDTEWRRYVIPSTGTSVEMPVTIFTKDAGPLRELSMNYVRVSLERKRFTTVGA